MKTFVGLAEIDSRYFEKPYYLLTKVMKPMKAIPFCVMCSPRRRRWQSTNLSCTDASTWLALLRDKKDLMLLIVRYADELRKSDSYFDGIETKTDAEAVKLATNHRVTLP